MFQFKPVRSETASFLKTFGQLYDAFETGEKGTSAEKVTLRDANEDVDKVCIEEQKTFDEAGGKPTRGFSLHSSWAKYLNVVQRAFNKTEF